MSKRRSPVQCGAWVEAVFTAEALRRRLRAFKPCSPADPIDTIVIHGSKLSRVQVRGTAQRERNGHRHSHVCSLVRSQRRGVIGTYQAPDVDFIAAYVIPRDTWYIIPVEDVAGQVKVSLRPGGKYEQYREAWHYLRQPRTIRHAA